jgi:outer membrane lipoprotein carrier protein
MTVLRGFLHSVLYIFLLTLTVLIWADDSIAKLAARVDQHYNRLKSLHANFEQIYEGGGLSRKESGELWLLKPGKMRWDYQQPRPKLFLTDNKTAYFYVPGDQQARRMPVKSLDDFRSPIRFLLGHTKLQKEFDHLTISLEKPLNPGGTVLEGVPQNMKDRVSRVLLEVTPQGQIVRIFIEELDGAITDFHFSNIQEDISVKAELFKFRVPQGVQLIETTEGGP